MEDKSIKISVIVAVYNIESYLEKCLDSLVKQTLREIEIIVVNDGSKDGSQDIIDKYQKEYKNIVKSYQKENGGVSNARNYGIKKASGQYITFIDGDDYVSYDMYEKMYNKAISNDFDMVVCDLNYVYDDKIVRVSSNIENDTTCVKDIYTTMYPCVWNKIYKKDLFDKGVWFKNGVWFEDVEFLYKLLPYVKNIGVVKEPLNQYVQRPGSITYTFDKRLYDYIDNLNGVVEFYKEKNFYNEYKEELEYCYVRYIYATFVKRCAKYAKEDYKKAVDDAIKNVKQNFSGYRKNKYFYKSIKGLYLLLFNKKLAMLIYKIYNK